jgi:hypothetical protein
MSVAQTLRAVELFRSFGVPVTFESGWDTRGNGQSSAYQGGILHHTGGSYANTCPGILIYGRSDLSGPLCNFAGLAGGGIHVVAAHPANHAGASGGPSNGPFPVTSLFNRLVMGLEICYPGSQPMTDAQYRTALVFAHVMKLMFGDIERARGHRETSIEGKWDPGYAPGQTINLAQLRATAANLEEDDVSAADVWNYPVQVVHGDGTTHTANAGDVLRYSELQHQISRDVAKDARAAALRVEAKVDALANALSDDEANIIAAVRAQPTGGQVDVEALAAQLRGALGDAVADELAQRLAS